MKEKIKEHSVRILLDEGAQSPVYKHSSDAGADISANEYKIVPAHGRVAVDTGVHTDPGDGWYIQIVPRSGLALKQGITVLNTPGTIDSNYRDSIKVILYNSTDTDFVVHKGDRIAQMILTPCHHAIFEQVMFLDETDRGNNGFGSTGVN